MTNSRLGAWVVLAGCVGLAACGGSDGGSTSSGSDGGTAGTGGSSAGEGGEGGSSAAGGEGGSSGSGGSGASAGSGGSSGSGATSGSGGTAGASGSGGTGGAASECGDSIVEGNEDCDDGNMNEDDLCLNNCRFACGDGVKNAVEECDTGIAAGMPGACPDASACDDNNACTQDTVSGSGCDTVCVNSAITAFVNDDGCCPAGATSSDDNDCSVECGNSVVETGETCDTGIASGMSGACPTTNSCDDGDACTVNAVSNDGTCTAACDFSQTLQPDLNSSDGCCPSGATSATDVDCLASCGNGVLDPGENCDTDISSGAGSCPTACNDNDDCTTDNLVQPGTCNAECTATPITNPANGDSCCPSGANANNDNDCDPVCGNNVTEPGEQCDNGPDVPNDGCDANCQNESLPVAFRLLDMDLRDPHILVPASIFGCRDLTDQAAPLNLSPSINTLLENSLTLDEDDPADGLLDLSFLVIFDPLDQSNGGGGDATITTADCTAPVGSTTCTATSMPVTNTVTYASQTTGTCLDVLAGTTGGYSPALTPASAPCALTSMTDFTVDLSGIVITLRNAEFAGTWSGSPATQIVNGVIRGFISETDADNTQLPADLPLVGGDPLSTVLPGGTGNCSNNDDKDMGPGGTSGWYFYFNYEAVVVPYTP